MHISNAPFNRTLVIDFETAWCTASGYTLSKMTTEEYIRDKRFLAWGLGWKEMGSAQPAQWVSHFDIPDFLATIDWTTTAVAAHNAAFDCAILAWVYGVNPVFIFDSLSMARALRGVEVGNSLDKLAGVFGLPAKGVALASTNGVLEGPLNPALEASLASYCCHDVYLAEQILAKLWMRYSPETNELKGPFPIKELRLIDMTIRMFTQPVFELDADMLREAIDKERTEREGLLQRLGIEEASLASNPKFALVLQAVGVDPPRKISKTTGKETFAFAKSDALFQALLNGDREDVALLCEARLKVKSTLERTRAQRLLDVAMRGTLPVPLTYFGAGTGRWSGKGGSLNLQNLKRGSFLRNAIMAPEGHVIIAGDLAQIEPRVLAWLADYTDLLALFADHKVDVYAVFGSRMFGVPGLTKETHPALRQSAKSALIGCIAKGSLVLTDAGLVPIQDVTNRHRVWDGVEWVTHAGVVYKGRQHVYEYQGLRATADHIVFTTDGREMRFDAAQKENVDLARTGRGWQAVGYGCSSAAGSAPGQWVRGSVVQVRRLRSREVDKLRQSKKREIQGMPALYAHSACAIDTHTTRSRHTIRRDTEPLHKPERRGVASIWRARHSPVVRVSAGFYRVRSNELSERELSRLGDRPYRQRRALRAWEHQASDTRGADAQHKRKQLSGYVWADAAHSRRGSAFFAEKPGSALRSWTRHKTSSHGAYSTADCGAVQDYGYAKQQAQGTLEDVYDIVLAGPRNRFTVSGVLVHNCGYSLSWANFAAQLLVGFLGAPPLRYDMEFAKQAGVKKADVERFLAWEPNLERMAAIPHTCTDEELLIHCVATRAIVTKYREQAWPIVSLWEMFQNFIVRCLVNGEEVTYKCLTFRKDEVELPSGMSLRYPNCRAGKMVEGRQEYLYGDNTRIYGGKLVENCIAVDTPVLTQRGWVPIQDVRTTDMVHDGEEFVCHGGVVYKSVQTCVSIDGVYMTPDHKVLTNEGWRPASSNPRPYRPDIRCADRVEHSAHRNRKSTLAFPVYLREANSEDGRCGDTRSEARWDAELRMLDTLSSPENKNTRAKQTSGVRRLGVNARTMFSGVSSGVQKLRSQRHNGVRCVGQKLHNVLGRYGADVPRWPGFRARRQQLRVQPRELRVGYTQRKLSKQTELNSGTKRARALRTDRHWVYNDLIPSTTRVARRASGDAAQPAKQVYDIINAGPRTRFVVLGDNGAFIVHNCTQALARIVMSDGMLRVDKRYPVKGTVHDELLCVSSESEAEEATAWVKQQMIKAPAWMPGIPLNAGVGYARRYGEAKD